MARRKKNNYLNLFLIILLIGLLAVLVIHISNNRNKNNNVINNDNNSTNNITTKTTNQENNNNTPIEKNETKNIETKPNSDEKQETKNEVKRRGGQVSLELVGDEEITISVGSNYKDAGFKATYSDGSDASDEVEVDNSVDTSTAGVYTVSYYVGNSAVIRRVTVE